MSRCADQVIRSRSAAVKALLANFRVLTTLMPEEASVSVAVCRTHVRCCPAIKERLLISGGMLLTERNSLITFAWPSYAGPI